MLIVMLIAVVATIVYRYQNHRLDYLNSVHQMKLNHENDMLKSQLEIQEQTFQNISREIHDNIGQKLTLAKLHLNTVNFSSVDFAQSQISDAVKIIGDSIRDLSDISRCMSSEVIVNNGFIKAVEFEINQLNKTRLYNIKLLVTGDTVYMESNRELLVFRIAQEALSNIMKHAEATQVVVDIHYLDDSLSLNISDNGKGFDRDSISNPNGLHNMAKRAEMLNGTFDIDTEKGKGSSIKIKIPLYES
jgi:signal transduction histidine kinase